MKLTRDGEVFRCTAKYVNDSMEQVICFSNGGDTVLIDNCIDGRRYGLSKRWYPNGQLMEYGLYENDARVGEWHGFFENGSRSYYKYYRLLNGKSQLFYDKIFDQNGVPEKFILPIDISTNVEEEYIVGEQYQMTIELLYSYCDSLELWAIINSNEHHNRKPDSIMFIGNKIQYVFIPDTSGLSSISGVLIEVCVDSLKLYGGEKPFSFKYTAVER